MKFKCIKAFTLLEVLFAVAILSTGVIIIFRTYATALSAMRLGQNITRANYLAEEKYWELEEASDAGSILPQAGEEIIQGTGFKWRYEISDMDYEDLKRLKLILSWKEGPRAKEYSVDYSGYLANIK